MNRPAQIPRLSFKSLSIPNQGPSALNEHFFLNFYFIFNLRPDLLDHFGLFKAWWVTQSPDRACARLLSEKGEANLSQWENLQQRARAVKVSAGHGYSHLYCDFWVKSPSHPTVKTLGMKRQGKGFAFQFDIPFSFTNGFQEGRRSMCQGSCHCPNLGKKSLGREIHQDTNINLW